MREAMNRFEQPSEGQQEMSEVEAREVVRLHAQEPGLKGQISVVELANTLGVQEQDVARLLAEVRGSGVATKQVETHRARKIRDVVVACFAACLLLLIGTTLLRSTSIVSNPRLNPSEYVIESNGVRIDLPTNVPLDRAEHSGDLIDNLTNQATNKFTPVNLANYQGTSTTLAGIQSGNWDAPGIEHVSLTMTAGPFQTETSLPFYGGADPVVKADCAFERNQRIRWALHDLAQQQKISRL